MYQACPPLSCPVCIPVRSRPSQAPSVNPTNVSTLCRGSSFPGSHLMPSAGPSQAPSEAPSQTLSTSPSWTPACFPVPSSIMRTFAVQIPLVKMHIFTFFAISTPQRRNEICNSPCIIATATRGGRIRCDEHPPERPPPRPSPESSSGCHSRTSDPIWARRGP